MPDHAQSSHANSHPAESPEPHGEMGHLARRASWSWYVTVLLLFLVAITVATQYAGGLARIGIPLVAATDRFTMVVGLLGLILLFILYMTLKRNETERLRIDLFTQRAAVTRIEARTDELESALGRLRALDEMKDSFLSTVAHELRTPLAAIQSYSEALITRDDAAREVRCEFLEIINREARRLALLINDLQDLSRLEAGRAEWRTETVALGPLVEQAVGTMAILARGRGVALTSDIAPALPDVEVDANRLAQVLTNLIGNAVKFTPAGGSVAVTARPDGRRAERAHDRPPAVCITVRDTGCGIPPEDLPRVFERFFRMPVAGDEVPGTGLGLAISKEIVDRIGGRLWAESVVGQGSAFHVVIPVPCRVSLQESS